MKKSSPAKQVEAFLREERRYNEDHHCWPSNNIVIDRMLASQLRMKDVYAELLEKCTTGKPAGQKWERWRYVIDAIVHTAAGWKPEKIKAVREGIKDIKDRNSDIRKTALKLADLLRNRNRQCETLVITRPADSHPLDLLEPAARISDRENPNRGHTYCLYTGWVKESVDALSDRFDFKYWPTTADLIEALADAQDFEPEAGNHIDAAALSVGEASNRDFMRALDESMGDLFRSSHGIKPFELSAPRYAALCNVLLGFDDKITSKAVNTFRYQERKRTPHRNE